MKKPTFVLTTILLVLLGFILMLNDFAKSSDVSNPDMYKSYFRKLIRCRDITPPLGETEGIVQQNIKTGLNIGDKAPEIKLPNPQGKFISLSSLKGKIVLIDFWAAWCGPCRFENPNIVSAYNKFKDKKFKNAEGFDIYSVSLDNQKEAWLKAIQKDGLVWNNHVSDLKWWYSEAAKTYNIAAIPTNVLIDATGIILAKNLRGAALEQELSKHLK